MCVSDLRSLKKWLFQFKEASKMCFSDLRGFKKESFSVLSGLRKNGFSALRGLAKVGVSGLRRVKIGVCSVLRFRMETTRVETNTTLGLGQQKCTLCLGHPKRPYVRNTR